MKPFNAKRQRGAALLALLAVLMLVASWFLVSQLNAESGGRSAVNRTRNAEVLNRAKLALIGYVAQLAASTDGNPGRLPCPEHPWYIGNSAKEGIAGPSVGVSSPGTGSSDCSSVGRLPWRTLGLEKLVDAAGEPLWYVVGPTWRLTDSNSSLLINSNTVGDITVDGQQVVALIIAPGAAIDVQTATGCTAKSQARSAPSSTIDATDYIECYSGLQFVTTAGSTSYNDQIVRITAADIMPAIEAAIANRIEREILPELQTVFTPATWGFSGSNPVLPFAAPFASPGFNTGSGDNTGTSNYQGAVATYSGLLPFNRTQGCTVLATDPRCTNTLMAWSSSGPVQSGGSGSIHTGEASYPNTCSWKSTDVFSCVGAYNSPSVTLSLTVTVTNAAMGLRKLDLSKLTFTAENDVACSPCDGQTSIPYTATVSMNADGSATISVIGTALPDISTAGWGSWATYTISFDRGFIGDHALLNPIDPPKQTPAGVCPTTGCTGWFVRNEWYRLLYYASARGYTADVMASTSRTPACPTTAALHTFDSSCIGVANLTPSNSQRAILILAGRSINGSSRPSATLADYLEFGNAHGSYETQGVSPVSAMIYADTGAANAYTVAVTSLATGASFQFKAANANTGTSTLNTTATGTRSLVNADGSSLAAGTIQANAAVQVIWDGTQFLLSKRPFNDRFAVLGSN